MTELHLLVFNFPPNLLNPKKGGGGLNQPTETLKACRAVLDEGMIFKPSCKFHFWCLLTTEKMALGVV